MNAYVVYWIKREVALHYFHKSDILYRFIKAYQENTQHPCLAKQFEYITHPFSKQQLLKHIFEQNNQLLNIRIDEQKIEIKHDGQAVVVYISEKGLTFYCDTLHVAENLLFPILKTINPYLFIMSYHTINYGWLMPIKENSLKLDRQLLYSYP